MIDAARAAEHADLIPVTKSPTEPGGRLVSYVDRILKGEKPSELPVQAPTKYEVGHQSKNPEGARDRVAADVVCHGRRGESAIYCTAYVSSWHLYDITRSRADFCF